MFDSIVEGIISTVNPVHTPEDKRRIFECMNDENDLGIEINPSYNYGIGYIKYVEQTDKQYTYQNAIAFSQKCKKEYNVSVYGDSKYVYHVLRYYTDTSLVDDWLELYR